MATEAWFDARWVADPSWGVLRWIPGGLYDPSSVFEKWPEGTITLPRAAVASLIPLLESEGYLKPRLDERLRAEDLKITHSLIDLLEKGA